VSIVYAKKGKKSYPVLVSDEDFLSLRKIRWHILDSGYVSTNYGSKKIYMHHLVAGYPDEGLVIDHIDGNRQNNTRENLRLVSQKENSANKHKNILSPTTGLCYSAKYSKEQKRLIELMYKDGKTEEEILEYLSEV